MIIVKVEKEEDAKRRKQKKSTSGESGEKWGGIEGRFSDQGGSHFLKSNNRLHSSNIPNMSKYLNRIHHNDDIPF